MSHPRIVIVSSATVAACPTHRLDPGHFRDDGTCKCFPPTDRQQEKEGA